MVEGVIGCEVFENLEEAEGGVGSHPGQTVGFDGCEVHIVAESGVADTVHGLADCTVEPVDCEADETLVSLGALVRRGLGSDEVGGGGVNRLEVDFPVTHGECFKTEPLDEGEGGGGKVRVAHFVCSCRGRSLIPF